MRGFSVLFRYDRPYRGDLHEQEAPHRRADYRQAERSRDPALSRDRPSLRPASRSKYPSRPIIAGGRSTEAFRLDQAKRLKELERENGRLKKLVADQALDNGDSQGGRLGKLLSPPKRRRAVERVYERFRVSERHACRVVRQARSTQRYQPRCRDDEERLTARVVELASLYGRYGYRPGD